jgi:hypothetical protein
MAAFTPEPWPRSERAADGVPVPDDGFRRGLADSLRLDQSDVVGDSGK